VLAPVGKQTVVIQYTTENQWSYLMLFQETGDLRITAEHGLLSPKLLSRALPLTASAKKTVVEAREACSRIIQQQDDRLLVVVGPCSVHDMDAVLEYGAKLPALIQKYREDLCIVMRVYFEKPRTKLGWKGFINDPDLDGSFNVNKGLEKARQLLLQLNDFGVACGTEYLDVICPQFFGDLISWGAIGARTVESQVHRELASGMPSPVGFKNNTDGNIYVAADAMKAASAPHHFLSINRNGNTAIFTTRGNDSTHMILRGGLNGPNYTKNHIMPTVSYLNSQGLMPHVMIDCSHGNSQKSVQQQYIVATKVAEYIAEGTKSIMGMMIESHLQGGSQAIDANPRVYGQSITDPCISYEKTEALLEILASANAKRRKKIKKIQEAFKHD